MQISISRLICDFVVLCCCALPLLIFQLWVKPYKRGFYCDDESIRYPFRESTVSRHMLIVVGLIIPTALIFMTEIFRTLAWERKCAGQFKQYRLRERGVHRLVVRLYVFMGYFLVGVCFNQVMVDIAKYTIGRHRPHFMDVCRPNIGYGECTDPDKYITEFNCTGSDPKKVHESMLSFYSGHSAFSFYAAWFTSLYLQARLYRPLYSRLVLPVIQVALFGGATFVAYSRVSDYKHHWSDVLVGMIMGSALGIFVALVVAEVFKRREIPSCDEINGEFGLIRLEPREGREGQTTNGCHNCGAPQIATHSITVTNEYDGPTNGAQQRLAYTDGGVINPQTGHYRLGMNACQTGGGCNSSASLAESFYTTRGDWDSLGVPSRSGSYRGGHYAPSLLGARSIGADSLNTYSSLEYLSVASTPLISSKPTEV